MTKLAGSCSEKSQRKINLSFEKCFLKDSQTLCKKYTTYCFMREQSKLGINIF